MRQKLAVNVTLLLIVALVAACQSTPASPTPAATKPAATTAAQSTSAPATTPASTKPAATTAATAVAKATSAATQPSIDACSLLTTAEVQAVIGKAVTAVTDSSDPRGVGCSYLDATTKSRLASLAVWPLPSASQAKEIHEATKGGGRDQVSVPGLGDDAYWDNTFSTLNVLRGRYATSLSVSSLDFDEALQYAKQLSPKLLSRLP